MSKLPEELADCVELQRLDLSHNSYVNLPSVVFRLPKIKAIYANNNYIMGKGDERERERERERESVCLIINEYQGHEYNFPVFICLFFHNCYYRL